MKCNCLVEINSIQFNSINTEHFMRVGLTRDENNTALNRYWTSQGIVCWTGDPI